MLSLSEQHNMDRYEILSQQEMTGDSVPPAVVFNKPCKLQPTVCHPPLQILLCPQRLQGSSTHVQGRGGGWLWSFWSRSITRWFSCFQIRRDLRRSSLPQVALQLAPHPVSQVISAGLWGKETVAFLRLPGLLRALRRRWRLLCCGRLNSSRAICTKSQGWVKAN